MNAALVLEDGTILRGESFGAEGVAQGEVVFNTAMMGYQEILTDPSYAGQIVTMTYPLIGSYGINEEDVESRKPFLSGFVVREYVDRYSNWRATRSLATYLKEHQIIGIQGIDTRALTRKIRSMGALRAVLATGLVDLEDLKRRVQDVPPMEGRDLASEVACARSYSWEANSGGQKVVEPQRHVVVIDCGVKFHILRRLADERCRVTVVPPTASIDELRRLRPDLILVSNGPGDPAAVPGLADVLRSLIGTVPLFGICLGHQLLALAAGARTYKLKFGHHGANHPVRDERSGRIEITSQNHGFAVDGDSLAGLDGKDFGPARITHIHLSDGTIEGFEFPEVRLRAIQYHPEASPGPHDASYLFEDMWGCIKTSSIA